MYDIYVFIKHQLVVPKLIQGAVNLLKNLIEDIGEEIVDLLPLEAKKTKCAPKRFSVDNTFNLGGSFKALGVVIKDGRILTDLLSSFTEIVSIVPDDEIQFDLPRPITEKKVFHRFISFWEGKGKGGLYLIAGFY